MAEVKTAIKYTPPSVPGQLFSGDQRTFGLQELRWSAPGDTRHIEFTVTENCYLIAAGTICSGCTLKNVQEEEPTVNIATGLPVADEDRMRFNLPFVTSVIQREADRENNLITYMGGEVLTIKGAEDLIDWTVRHPVVNGLVYSSSAYYFKPDGTPNNRYSQHRDAGLFSPEFGYFKSSVDRLILDEKELAPKDHSWRAETFKSLHGLRLTERLANEGYDVAIHQTLRRDNLDDTIRLYEWAKERGIKYSLCPLVWLPYVSAGAQESFYGRRLTSENETQLREIVDYMMTDTVDRFQKGEKRILIPSSAFMRLIPKFGPDNGISCRVHRQGNRPNGEDIHPSGQGRWCIAKNTEKDGHKCNGCFYIGIDRGGSDYWNFEHLAGELKEGDVRWLNSDVWKKGPNYDITGRNLFLNHRGEPLVVN